MNTTVVFAGPSLFKGHEYFGNIVTFMPPLEAGDLLNTVINNPHIRLIVICDGFFFEKLSVLHREIIEVVNSGVQVIGCSSLGALRAVELRNFGMQGFGSVYDYYLRNQGTGDDEVGLIHSDSSLNYRHLSIPLINLRLLKDDLCDSSMKDLLAELIILFEQLPFMYRSRTYLLRLAKIHPAKSQFCKESIKLLDIFYLDYKSLDLALLLLILWSLSNDVSEASSDEYFSSENINKMLPAILQSTVTGQNDMIRYVLSPHRRLTHDFTANNPVTELGYRDLSLICSPHHIAVLRMQSYRRLLLKEALVNGLNVSSDDILLLLSKLISNYGVPDLTSLAMRLRLTNYELLKLAVEESLILVAEHQIFSSSSMALNIGSFTSTLRIQGLFPEFSNNLIKNAFFSLKKLFQSKNPLDSYKSFKILSNNHFFDDFLSIVFAPPNFSPSSIFNKKSKLKAEYIESIERLSIRQDD